MKLSKISISIILAVASLSSYAMTDAEKLEQKNNIEKRLIRINPDVKVQSVNETGWKNVYEIVMTGNQIIYSDSDASHIMAITPSKNSGSPELSLINVDNRVNITDNRRDILNKVDYSKLPAKNAIIIKKGNGKNKLSVFADPNCTFCKSFEKKLDKLENITIQVYLYPILGKDSIDKSNSIWCAKPAKRAETWSNWMINNTPIPSLKCDTETINENLELGKKLGITGTPTIIFGDGSRISGDVGSDYIINKLKTIN